MSSARSNAEAKYQSARAALAMQKTMAQLLAWLGYSACAVVVGFGAFQFALADGPGARMVAVGIVGAGGVGAAMVAQCLLLARAVVEMSSATLDSAVSLAVIAAANVESVPRDFIRLQTPQGDGKTDATAPTAAMRRDADPEVTGTHRRPGTRGRAVSPLTPGGKAGFLWGVSVVEAEGPAPIPEGVIVEIVSWEPGTDRIVVRQVG